MRRFNGAAFIKNVEGIRNADKGSGNVFLLQWGRVLVNAEGRLSGGR
jgi:hypothetical protein